MEQTPSPSWHQGRVGKKNSRFDCRDLFQSNEFELVDTDGGFRVRLKRDADAAADFCVDSNFEGNGEWGRFDKTEGDCSYLRNRLGLLLNC